MCFEHAGKSGLIIGGQIWSGLDMTLYKKMAGFRLGPKPDMISSTILIAITAFILNSVDGDDRC